MWPCVAWLKHDLLTFTSKFKVKEGKEEKNGSDQFKLDGIYTLKIDQIAPGYFHISLFSSKSAVINPVLLLGSYFVLVQIYFVIMLL